MADNLTITRTENSQDGKGTAIYFTFAYPVSGTSIDGHVVLANDVFIKSLSQGTAADVYAGLYSAVMTAIGTDIKPYVTQTTEKAAE